VEQSWLDELREFIAIPSVSADPAHEASLAMPTIGGRGGFAGTAVWVRN
jgi:hypothetical protein